MTLWYHAGSFGRPKLDAIRITSSASEKYTSGTVRSRPLFRPRTVSSTVGSAPASRFRRPLLNRINFGSTFAATLIPYQSPGFESANGMRRRFMRVGGRSGSTLGIGTCLAYAQSGAGIAAGHDPVEAGSLDGDPIPPGATESPLGHALPASVGPALDDDQGPLAGGRDRSEDVTREDARAQARDRRPRGRAVGGDSLDRARGVGPP